MGGKKTTTKTSTRRKIRGEKNRGKTENQQEQSF